MRFSSFLAFLVVLLVGLAFIVGVLLNSCDVRCEFAIEQQRMAAYQNQVLLNDQRLARAERERVLNEVISVAGPPMMWMVSGAIFVLSCGLAWRCFVDFGDFFRHRRK